MTVLRLINVVELRFDGTSMRPWRAIAAAEGQTVHGLVSFEVWADTPGGVITDLLSVLDFYSIETAGDMCLQFDACCSAPTWINEPDIAGQAHERGWSYTEFDGHHY